MAVPGGRPARLTITRHSPAAIERVWAALSDTDRFNRLVGLDYHFTDRPGPEGVVREAWIRQYGLRVQLTEQRFDFTAPSHYQIDRVYRDGPAEHTRVTLRLDEDGGGTALRYVVETWPRSSLLYPLIWALTQLTARALRRGIDRYLAALTQPGRGLPLLPGPTRGGKRAALVQQVAALQPAEVARPLSELLASTPREDLGRLAPLALAAQWGLPVDGVLDGFLRGVAAELLQLRWELLCPSCRGGPALMETPPPADTRLHCPSCDIRYGPGDPTAISVTFRPALRDLERPVRCMGSPARTPHIIARAVLPAAGEIRWALDLSPGVVFVRRRDRLDRVVMSVEPGEGPRELTLVVGPNGVQPERVMVSAGPVGIDVRSAFDAPVEVVLERRLPPPHVLTAGRLLTRPLARRLLEDAGMVPTLALEPQGLLVAEAFHVGLLEPVHSILDGLGPVSLNRDERLLIAAWPTAGQALHAAGRICGQRDLCCVLAYGPVIRTGPLGAPMGPAVDRAIALLRASLPGHVAISQADLDTPEIAACLARPAEEYSLLDGPDLPGSSGKVLVFHHTAPLLTVGSPAVAEIPSEIRGRYVIGEKLGQGGFGSVHVATDRQGGGDLVIKLLHADRSVDLLAVQQFYTEARICSTLDHPQIVRVHDFGHTDSGMLFIAMERLRGETLLARLSSGGPLSQPELCRLTIDLLDALEAVHAAGLRHRDLKPENVLICDGRAHLIDFGIAIPIRQATQPGQIMGTVRYLPPESFDEGEVDHRADLYAMGLLMYESVAGRLPFAESGDLAMAYRRSAEEMPPVAQMTHRLTPEVAAVIDRAVRIDPDERFESAARMQAALVAASSV